MSVNRYEFELYHCNGGEMLVSDAGDYVSYEDYAALEARCAALAAENAGLKQFPDQIVGFIGKLGSSEIGSETKEKIEAAAKKIKTPATDAFLAEVRAQGVEMFAATLGSPYVERGEECYQDGYTHAIERIKCRKAPEFAAQLRKGVQS